MPLLSINTDGRLQPHLTREWLLTNGLGGFSHSTLVGCNTRRYHGLLVAATNPPVGRIMALDRSGEILTLDGKDRPAVEFSGHQLREAVHPQGWQDRVRCGRG